MLGIATRSLPGVSGAAGVGCSADPWHGFPHHKRQPAATAARFLLAQLGDALIEFVVQRWNAAHVRAFRPDRRITVYREGEREEFGEITLEQAARILGVSQMTVLRVIRAGALPAQQLCHGAPWVIRREDLQRPAVRDAMQSGATRPQTADANQTRLESK